MKFTNLFPSRRASIQEAAQARLAVMVEERRNAPEVVEFRKRREASAALGKRS